MNVVTVMLFAFLGASSYSDSVIEFYFRLINSFGRGQDLNKVVSIPLKS